MVFNLTRRGVSEGNSYHTEGIQTNGIRRGVLGKAGSSQTEWVCGKVSDLPGHFGGAAIWSEDVYFNLETAVGSQKSAQALGAPGTKKMSHHHRGDHDIFYCTMHPNILHGFFAPNCRF